MLTINDLKEKYMIYGGMGLGGDWNSDSLLEKDILDGFKAIETALDMGIQFFDFADIYRSGKSEKVMGAYLKQNPSLRDKIIIQSKVGIRLKAIPEGSIFDFSYDHIIKSVDGILERLNTNYLDVLLLHRPDPLMDKNEIKEAIDELFKTGKIKALGVSNMDYHQIQLLESYTGRKIVVNQLELSLSQSDFVYNHIGFNNSKSLNSTYTLGTTEYCMQNNISLQSWSPLSQGIYTGRKVEPLTDEIKNTSALVEKYSKEYGVSKEGIVLAWLLRHPANIKPVIGTTNIERIKACQDAFKIKLEREHWYRLLVAARGVEMP